MIVELVDSRSLYTTDLAERDRHIPILCEQRPRTWVWRNPPPRPAGHFGTLFGARTMKRYDNPYIGDLSMYHEHMHDLTLRFDPSDTHRQWIANTIDSEVVSSTYSEAYVYIHNPWLRAKTFDFDIWVDRFLKDEAFMKKHPLAAEFFIATARKDVYQAAKFDDVLERQIRSYYDQNFEWCDIWDEPVGYGPFKNDPAFRVVQRHMSSPDRDDPHHHIEWLKAVSANSAYGDDIPFLNQANAFEPMYFESLRKYGSARQRL